MKKTLRFEVGDEVTVIKTDDTGQYGGMKGRIAALADRTLDYPYDYGVLLEDNDDGELAFKDEELKSIHPPVPEFRDIDELLDWLEEGG